MGVPFHEVFVDVPIEVVQKRDPKGLYAKVASGVIKSFTGLSKDAPYEQPLKPEVHLHTDKMTLEEEVDTMVEHLRKVRIAKLFLFMSVASHMMYLRRDSNPN